MSEGLIHACTVGFEGQCTAYVRREAQCRAQTCLHCVHIKGLLKCAIESSST